MPYFDRVQRFCFFIAPARSGHSIVGHLLTAHPDVLISDELDALQYFREGYSAAQVYALIKQKDANHQRRNRKKSGYDYSVRGTFQDDNEKRPVAIGDAKGQNSLKALAEVPDLVNRVRAAVGVPLRAIVQVRHPFDLVAAKIRRKQSTLATAVDQVIGTALKIEHASNLLRDDQKFYQVHEDLIADPKVQFEKLFRFLDVEPIPEIVEACAKKIWREPRKARREINWEPVEQERLTEAMRRSKFFAHYFNN